MPFSICGCVSLAGSDNASCGLVTDSAALPLCAISSIASRAACRFNAATRSAEANAVLATDSKVSTAVFCAARKASGLKADIFASGKFQMRKSNALTCGKHIVFHHDINHQRHQSPGVDDRIAARPSAGRSPAHTDGCSQAQPSAHNRPHEPPSTDSDTGTTDPRPPIPETAMRGAVYSDH